MSVHSQINRIKQNVLDALAELRDIGVAVPVSANSDDLADLIAAIPVQRIYTGSSDPTSSLGENGDIYIKITQE